MPVHDFDKIQPQRITDLYRRKIAHGENMSVARVEAGQGSVTAAHRHSHEEVIILLKGSWRFQMPNHAVTLRPNQILTIPAGVEHSSVVLEDVLAIDVSGSKRT